jgi:hypothetical protein
MELGLEAHLLEMFEQEAHQNIDNDDFRLLEEGHWIQDGKRQVKKTITEYKGRFFKFVEARTGSPYTDWYYDEPNVFEVKPVEKTIVVTEWEKVN